jgi:hypothetical protein
MTKKSKTTTTQTDPDVIAFLRELDHPLKRAVESLRKIILGVSPEIHEGIKWNSPSFRTTDWFATVNLRAKNGTDRAWLILHTGATAKGKVMKDQIADSAGLLEWLGKDRCVVTFESDKDVAAKKAPLQQIVRQWIGHM